MTCCEGMCDTRPAATNDDGYPEWLIATGIMAIILLGLIALGLLAVFQPSLLFVAIIGAILAVLLGAVAVRLLTWGDTYNDRVVTWGVFAGIAMVMDVIVTVVTLFAQIMATSG